ncbi:hypothetical protein C943_04234 [Mariniradius saccharolyticus AK6]|uniref:Uncharacterized protein n=1 Tax=Mariniradius saccharolyticus AK6 TaxID=1239962 RepID=M7X955_9BACT|nr:hypothetical protein [Mariniradius saccharolyticus]EMS33915.1 hypothetical protein C943_04234 [Mariniradius saccharolyticus AK6]
MNKIEPVWEIKKPQVLALWDFESNMRFEITEENPIDLILSKLNDRYLKTRFTSEGLRNPYLEQEKIRGILERWSNNLPVDPPRLLWSIAIGSLKTESID